MADSPWFVVVRRRYEEAVRAWQTGQATVDRPRFWQLKIDLDDVLAKAAAEIVECARSRKYRHSLEVTLVLFHLLETRLTNVRGNHLWPEVAAELGRIARADLPADLCAAHFRALLVKEYDAYIDGITNRFVHFTLEEARVGRNRSHIVKDFLDSLLDDFLENPSSAEPEEFVDGFARRYIQRAASGDVEALSTVLRKSGTVLAQLASHVYTEGSPTESALWDGGTLRGYWLERSGVDLNRILPEAREVFDTLVGKMADRVAREGLAQMLLNRQVVVEFPPAAGVSTCETNARSLPLCPVRVRCNSTSKDVVIRDEFGLSAEAIRTYSPGVWHNRGRNGVFFWQGKPFLVRLGAWHSEKSVPIFTGTSIDEARRAGEFWSGTLAKGVLPTIEGQGLSPRVEPGLRVAHYWI